ASPAATGRGAGASGATIRGLALIVGAVLVGIVLLRATDPSPTFASTDRGPVVTPDTDGSTEATEAPGDGTTAPTAEEGEEDTTTTDPDGGRAEVQVVVTNAADGVAGLAGRVSAEVEEAGFTDVDAVDADVAAPASVVYFAPGFEDAAAEVAELLDPVPDVAALPDPAPATSGDLSEAEVVVFATADLDG
ncbi:MAG: LytR C-terminal domain-containing protein, partial [Acidimicrobiia bacterium]|nr:LytR C-terminal domain-containing protein [Acidimicrobiia bacterium]